MGIASAGTLAGLAPVGRLETVLAERFALLLWRMNRVARFERVKIAVGQERVVDDFVQQLPWYDGFRVSLGVRAP